MTWNNPERPICVNTAKGGHNTNKISDSNGGLEHIPDFLLDVSESIFILEVDNF